MAEGSCGYFLGGEEVFVPSQKIAVQDTVGAGDTFFNAAIAYLFDHEKLFHRSLVSQMNANELKTI